ncbi:protein MpDIR20 [Marchantia polymorpha subsp. ruderalis]|uniref:Dirigent protein n=2 Tax=Marchantia polymorpha TaxID=3197 RepID=A0AAF6BRD4_MARPO|nr:hypothetical protein MARPO_0059s0077 [Marchantia polymorpha]BBN14568.1 hypothetical protein Mp_6g12700 [Marchantia polymorpha subsp. ruderalis]|eukprot:PTQ37151.1 hypothetical protein MARPO_0059s0077 [Marchantia polymorpha]
MRSPRLVIVVLSILQLFQCTKEVGAAGPANLILYAHESRVPPTQTLIGSAAPNGNLTDEQFGLIKTVSNVLRAGKNNDSMVVGSQVGIVVLGKDVLNIYISYTYFLNNDSGFGGSTIAVHGHIDATSMGNRVFAVVGGTGQFLSVTGQDTSPFDAYVIDDSHTVNTHTLELRYPSY